MNTTNLAGTTQIPVGTRVRIIRLQEVNPDYIEEPEQYEGQEGVIGQPFRGLMWPGVEYVAGVRLDDDSRFNLTANDVFEVAA